MPVEVCWDDEGHTIIREVFSGLWAIDDQRLARRAVLELCAHVDHAVSVIVVLNRARFPVTIARHFPELDESFLPGDPRQSIFVLVGLGPFESLLFEMFMRAYPVQTRRLFIAGSVEEARQIIEQRRRSVVESAG